MSKDESTLTDSTVMQAGSESPGGVGVPQILIVHFVPYLFV